MSRSLPAISVLVAVALFALFALSACGSAGDNRSANVGVGTSSAASGSSSTSGNLGASSGNLGAGGGPAWTLSLPASINGDPRLASPSARTQQELQQGMQEAERIGGISGGTTMSGVYDDAADDAWLVVLGVNGTGFDGSELVDNVEHRQGVAIGDAASTIVPEPATVGPHGGSAICDESSTTIDTVDGAVSSATGTCYWMTPTTYGVVTLITKLGSPIPAYFIQASKVDAVMQTVRPAVETRG